MLNIKFLNMDSYNSNNFTMTTSDFEYYSCKFSPFISNRIACTLSQYYGMIGNGRLSIYDFDLTSNKIIETKRFPTNEGCFDLAWSEVNDNIISTCQGDGTIKFWDTNKNDSFPVGNINAHGGEVYSLSWNIHQPNMILSSSHDMTIKLHDCSKLATVNTLTGHLGVVYSAVWHPTVDGLMASASSDNTFKIWDLKKGDCVKTVKAHNGHVMTCDFNKYENMLATGGSDGSFAIWDLRGTSDVPVLALNGHSLSVKKLAFYPFNNSILTTVGYDMNVRIWDTKQNLPCNIFKHHREFVVGVDFSLFNQDLIASCSWDRTLSLFNWKLKM